jgi:ATP-dependent helicase HepA
VNGLIVQHRTYGYGKVTELTSAGAKIRFCSSGQIVSFGSKAFENRDLKHARLLVETPMRGPRGLCVIASVPAPTTPNTELFEYGVQYEDGLFDRISELELTPLVTVDSVTPVGQLASFLPQPVTKLIGREKFVDALTSLASRVGGLRALLASRIELHPHQAYVAGTVILDPQRRYILADEVGLGKTIEAGVVIHDRLMQKPESRILILAPGALTRQWLCELHTSFGGQDFRLLDLHPIEVVRSGKWPRVICSTGVALQSLASWIEANTWDMVVVDEAHHLLGSDSLYSLVTKLSERVRDLLLLSALPARSREQEFLKLLRLLEPLRYRTGLPAADRFSELYAAQSIISRRISRLANDVRDFQLGEAAATDVVEMIDNLLSLPVLSEDEDLKKIAAKAHDDPETAAVIGTTICSEVIDRYRINRRILRNRRAKLIEDNLLTQVRRRAQIHEYVPSQLEVEAQNACAGVLHAVQRNDCPVGVLRPLTRSIFCALASPSHLLEFLRNLKQAKPRSLSDKALEFINLAGGVSYESWTLTEDVICAGARSYVEADVLDVAIATVRQWVASTAISTRIQELFDVLDESRTADSKIIVFAGLKGFADTTADALEKKYGTKEVVRFTHSLDDAQKEENVRTFRAEKQKWLLVCDESGGEGRNFQFAAAVLHLDLPWAVSAIEQRVGRLDRIGRSGDVVSHVICSAASIESAWCSCLKDGFGVFTQSISGVEFGLRQLQDRAIDAAVEGIDALASLIPFIASDTAQERALDDANALLDDASGRGLSSFSFGRGAVPHDDKRLEEGFVEFFRLLASRGSARSISDARSTTGLWNFRPDEMRNLTVTGLDRGEGGLLPEHLGTFDRNIARGRRDVEFFCFGNRLFDAIAEVAMSRPIGRSFAVSVAGSGLSPAILFEIQAFAEPDVTEIGQFAGLVNRARLVVDRRRTSILLHVSNLEPATETKLQQVVMEIRMGRLTVTDIAPGQIAHLATSAGVDWGTQVKAAIRAALPIAKSRFEPRLSTAISSEIKIIADQRRRCLNGEGEDVEEVARLDALRQSLERWETRLDTIGLFVIN